MAKGKSISSLGLAFIVCFAMWLVTNRGVTKAGLSKASDDISTTDEYQRSARADEYTLPLQAMLSAVKTFIFINVGCVITDMPKAVPTSKICLIEKIWSVDSPLAKKA